MGWLMVEQEDLVMRRVEIVAFADGRPAKVCFSTHVQGEVFAEHWLMQGA
jgi:hypothetical protein